MSREPRSKPLAWGAFGRPKRIWRYDDDDIIYERGGYEYED